ncbi:MAG: prenyltransferase, partial [Candidatus Binatia bacterium]
MLTKEQIEASADWIASHQSAEGALPWWRGGKLDPWDHVHSAMGLTVAGRIDEAKHAYRYLEATQTAAGGWYAWREDGKVTNRTQETNHAAYPATGIWQLYLATSDEAFLAEMWP